MSEGWAPALKHGKPPGIATICAPSLCGQPDFQNCSGGAFKAPATIEGILQDLRKAPMEDKVAA
eukprot:3352758-Pyramimonas_sp.AAC.1